MPPGASRPLAVAILAAELATGGCLLFGIDWAKVAAIALLALFSVVALIAIRHDQEVPCNCFGADSSEHLSLSTVVRNTVLAGLMASTFFVAGSQSASLSKSYGLIAFLLFLCVNSATRNDHDFREALKWRLLA